MKSNYLKDYQQPIMDDIFEKLKIMVNNLPEKDDILKYNDYIMIATPWQRLYLLHLQKQKHFCQY